GGDLAQRPSDHFLRMAEPVDGRRIHPVDAARDRVADGRDRIGVVLASPAVRPSSAADGPGAETDLRDSKTARSQWTLQQCFHQAFSFAYSLTIAEISRSGVCAATAAKSWRARKVNGTGGWYSARPRSRSLRRSRTANIAGPWTFSRNPASRTLSSGTIRVSTWKICAGARPCRVPAAISSAAAALTIASMLFATSLSAGALPIPP